MVVFEPSRRALLRGELRVHSIALIGDGCLAKAGIVCCSCGDVCHAAAIRFPPRIGSAPQPQVDGTACTGCGDCVSVCPSAAVILGSAPEQAPS